MLSYLISRKLQKVPILEIITRQDGLYLPAMEEEREQESLLVEDAMRIPKHVPLSSGVTVTQARALTGHNSEKYLLVLPSPKAWGVVGADELEEFERVGKGEETIDAVLQHRAIPHLYSDQDLDVALRYAQEWPLIPVVRRTNINQIQGVIDLEDILNAYRQAGTD
jgi:CIC family chloride channel protein